VQKKVWSNMRDSRDDVELTSEHSSHQCQHCRCL